MRKLLTIGLCLSCLLTSAQRGVLMVQRTATTTPTYINLSGSVVFCHGNSLTEGIGGTAYPTQLGGLSGITGVVDDIVKLGTDGGTTQDMSDEAPTNVDNWLPLSYTYHILIAWEIGNDIYDNGSVTDAQTRFAAYCNARKTAGWDRVIVLTMPPRNQTTLFGDNPAQFNTKLSEANTWLRANYDTFADELVDVAADSRLSDYTNTTYFSDGTHLTTAGYAVVAELVRNKLIAME